MKQYHHKENAVYHILGAGAMGGMWAAKIAESGGKVTLVGKAGGTQSSRELRLTLNNQTCQTIAGRSTTQTHTVEFTSADQLEDGSINILVVATKADQTVDALNSISSKLACSCTSVCLGNGLGYQQDIVQTLSGIEKLKLFWAVTSDGATRNNVKQQKGSPGLVVDHTGSGHTIIGPLINGEANASSAHGLVTNLVRRLADAGLSVEFDKDINPFLWRKFFINCTINPLTAIYRCPNGELISNPEYHHRFKTICDELERLMRKVDKCPIVSIGKPLSASQRAVSTQTEEFPSLYEQSATVVNNTAANTSSMLQDVLAGRATEIEYLNRYADKLARQSGIACPLNAALLQEFDRTIRALSH